jgi:hypothetical protein
MVTKADLTKLMNDKTVPLPPANHWIWKKPKNLLLRPFHKLAYRIYKTRAAFAVRVWWDKFNRNRQANKELKQMFRQVFDASSSEDVTTAKERMLEIAGHNGGPNKSASLRLVGTLESEAQSIAESDANKKTHFISSNKG